MKDLVSGKLWDDPDLSSGWVDFFKKNDFDIVSKAEREIKDLLSLEVFSEQIVELGENVGIKTLVKKGVLGVDFCPFHNRAAVRSLGRLLVVVPKVESGLLSFVDSLRFNREGFAGRVLYLQGYSRMLLGNIDFLLGRVRDLELRLARAGLLEGDDSVVSSVSPREFREEGVERASDGVSEENDEDLSSVSSEEEVEDL